MRKRDIPFILREITSAIQLGWDDFKEKLSHLQRIFGVLEERQLWNSVVAIDLDYENRAYIEGLFPFSKGT